MKHIGIILLPAVLVLSLLGCTASHEHPPVVTPPDPAVVVVDPAALPSASTAWGHVEPVEPPALTGIESCLAAGGELVEMDSVDNNDREDHGDLLTLGVSRTGVLAAAGADGTLKFWTLDTGFLATVDGSALTYGSEEGRVPVTDLEFLDGAAIAGDIRGLVAHMAPDGTFYPVGGTTPDVPIRSVAVHAATHRFAHAQIGDVLPLVVRSTEDATVFEIASTLEEPNDLVFAPTGELLVAGASGGPAIEIRGATDPSVVLETLGFHGSQPITEIAHARAGTVAAAISAQYIYVLDRLGVVGELWLPEHDGVTVDVTPSGAFVLSAGADGQLLAHGSGDGLEVARVAVTDPVTVRVDATGTLVFVGSRDAIIHVFACTAP